MGPRNTELAQSLGINLSGLNNDSKNLAMTIIEAITTYMDRKLEDERRAYQSTIQTLETKLVEYEEKLDDLENYGRRNTIVISGPSLPTYQPHENSIAVAKSLIETNLGMEIDGGDICVAHRLGSPRTGGPDKRNIIV